LPWKSLAETGFQHSIRPFAASIPPLSHYSPLQFCFQPLPLASIMATSSALDRKYLLLAPCFPGLQPRKLTQVKYFLKKNELRRLSITLSKADLPKNREIHWRFNDKRPETAPFQGLPAHRKGRSVNLKSQMPAKRRLSQSFLWNQKLSGVQRQVKQANYVVKQGRRLSFSEQTEK